MMLKMIKRVLSATVFLSVLGLGFSAHAEIKITITGGVDRGIPVAVVPFAVSGQPLPASISDIIEADLASSGRFEPIPRGDFLSRPTNAAQISYKNWRLLKANALVVGQVRQLGGNTYEAEFRLMDVYKETQIAGWRSPPFSTKQHRRIAHKIADIIYEKMTGVPGVFDTKIAYVSKKGNGESAEYTLWVADSDGYGPHSMFTSRRPIMSPSWSPDGQHLAYVTYQNRQMRIMRQNVYGESRQSVVSEFPRINSSPAWSPDGRRMAMSLSKDGNPEIYVKDLTSGQLTRVTQHSANDSEPSWSPDGRSLLFTSGRAGRPQVYRVAANGGPAQRVIFDGGSNAAASYSPDGAKIVVITAQGGGDKVGVYDVRSRVLTTLTNGRLDDSPSFAPNGAMVLYSAWNQGREVLATVSTDGRVQRYLTLASGRVQDAAWSPRLP